MKSYKKCPLELSAKQAKQQFRCIYVQGPIKYKAKANEGSNMIWRGSWQSYWSQKKKKDGETSTSSAGIVHLEDPTGGT